MDAQEIRALIEIFEQSSLSELILEREGARLTLRKEGTRAQIHSQLGGLTSETPKAHSPEPRAESSELRTITSPLVGMFYRRPAPTEPPYVEVGDRVEKGDTLCIIEAMKVMNEIKSEHAGVVEKILVEDGKPVEYGQPLMVIRP